MVPLGNLLMEATGTWSTVLYTVAIMDLLSATCAIVVLRPMLARHHARNAEEMRVADMTQGQQVRPATT
jgi:OFA family oxalate/formate antiporter-like MFS transporter